MRRGGGDVNGLTWSRVLRVAAVSLVASAVLAIVGQVVYAFSFPGGSFGDRLDIASQRISNPTVAAILLGAAIVTVAQGDTDWVLVAAGVLGALVTLAAIYSIIHLISVRIPSPGATGQNIQVGVATQDWTTKLGEILLRAAGGVLGASAAWIAASSTGVRERLARRPTT
jgi:hypothetical protein